MRVLSVASECVPLVKTGGLADVAGALPGALSPLGIEMRTLLPGYPVVMDSLTAAKTVARWGDLFGGPADVKSGVAGGLEVFVLVAPHLYDRAGTPYLGPDGQDWPDNPERFAALSWVAAEMALGNAGSWIPEVLHAHDWQAALAPWYLRQAGNDTVGTLVTIHNIAFSGLAPVEKIDALRLSPDGFTPEGYEFYGRISALKAGLISADRITTVSPTYARELMTPEFGMGLDGVIRSRANVVSGILNGIDTAVWNPTTDPEINHYRDLRGKEANRTALIKEFDLDNFAPGPLCVVISRLTTQKGLDLLADALPTLLAQGGQLALLGSGETWLEDRFMAAGADGRVSVKIGYDEPLSHRMIAGGDAILVPSRFEPCGLTQLYGLRYGTLPVVALTGGLADTVIPASAAGLAAGVATGLQVHPLNVDALRLALTDLCALYQQRKTWAQMVENAMAHPVGWEHSAKAYATLYQAVSSTD